MTHQELRAICIARFGEGWQSKLARHLGVNPRTVRRWASGEIEVPPAAQAALGAAPHIAKDYPDEWLIAADPNEDREYMIHLAPPRFVARIGDGDASRGLVLSLREEDLFDFTWVDPQPGEEELQRLVKAAQKTIDMYSM